MSLEQIRKIAKQQGYKVHKNPHASRVNDYDEAEYFMLVNEESSLVEPGCESMTLDEIEAWLKG